MTSAFSVTVETVDVVTGRIEGPDLQHVAKFLRFAGGPALFDLDHDGRLFCRCRLDAARATDAILFTYEEAVPVEPFGNYSDSEVL